MRRDDQVGIRRAAAVGLPPSAPCSVEPPGRTARRFICRARRVHGLLHGIELRGGRRSPRARPASARAARCASGFAVPFLLAAAAPFFDAAFGAGAALSTAVQRQVCRVRRVRQVRRVRRVRRRVRQVRRRRWPRLRPCRRVNGRGGCVRGGGACSGRVGGRLVRRGLIGLRGCRRVGRRLIAACCAWRWRHA